MVGARRFRLWLLCFLALVGGLFPASTHPAMAQEQPLAGMRGSLYQSPTFGYTVVLHPVVWNVDAATSQDRHDRLQFSNDSIIVWLAGADFPGGTGGNPHAGCVDQTLSEFVAPAVATTEIRQIYPADNAPIAPFDSDFDVSASASWELSLEDGSTLFLFIECLSYASGDPAVAPDFMLVTTVVTTMDQVGASGDRWSLPEEFQELSVAPPSDGWDPNVPMSPSDPGYLEFDFSLSSTVRLGDGVKVRPVVVYITNVDAHPIDFDPARIRLESTDGELSEPLKFVMVGGTVSPSNSPLLLEPGDWVAIYYELNGEGFAAGICYLNSQNCAQILICVFDSHCAVGSRPRFQIGR